MRFTSILAVVSAIPLLVSAGPISLTRRQNENNILVLTFADVLEQLESGFYKAALEKFVEADFIAAGFANPQVAIEQFKVIQKDEETHSAVLQSTLKTLGATPKTDCKFTFDAALKDVNTMAATARVVEAAGVGAYIGGAILLTDTALLAAGASILSVEARHSTLLTILSGTGTAVSSAFDLALAPNEVLSIAAPFFDGACDLGVPANPVLSLTNTGTVGVGTLLTFDSPAFNGSTTGLFCQMLIPGQPISVSLPIEQCVVPQINGLVAVFVTRDNQPLLNNVRDRTATTTVAGPILAYFDTQPQALGALTRGGSGAPVVAPEVPAATTTTTISTATLTPDQASSAIEGSPTGVAPAPPVVQIGISTVPANAEVIAAPSTTGAAAPLPSTSAPAVIVIGTAVGVPTGALNAAAPPAESGAAVPPPVLVVGSGAVPVPTGALNTTPAAGAPAAAGLAPVVAIGISTVPVGATPPVAGIVA